VIGLVADAHSKQELEGLKEYKTLLLLQSGLNGLAEVLKSNLNSQPNVQPERFSV
jgi:hypothetical protein